MGSSILWTVKYSGKYSEVTEAILIMKYDRIIFRGINILSLKTGSNFCSLGGVGGSKDFKYIYIFNGRLSFSRYVVRSVFNIG